MSSCLLVLVFLLVLVILFLFLGTLLYAHLFQEGYLDAFCAVALLLTSVNNVRSAKTNGQKIFLAVYALVTIFIFFSLTNVFVLYLLEKTHA